MPLKEYRNAPDYSARFVCFVLVLLSVILLLFQNVQSAVRRVKSVARVG